MSKEAHERGLVLTGRPKYDRVSTREEERDRPRKFVPEARDVARLLPRLAGASRR